MTGFLTLKDFDYILPDELIAQQPAATRTDSRLLHVDARGQLFDRGFTALLDLLKPNDLLVFNNTRVIKARLFGQKESGGKVEVLVERITSPHCALAHIRSSRSPLEGSRLRLADAFEVLVTGREHNLFKLQFDQPVLERLEQYGSTPLPPYIEHTPDEHDIERYQTVYATTPGAVAAPTAGLHFDDSLLAQLKSKGIEQAFVTLHVGAGTFAPVKLEKLDEHIMHAEWYEVPTATADAIVQAKRSGGRVIAVGTTSVRALESAARAQAIADSRLALTAHSDDTRLFITPGFKYQVVDALITNFHLPQSTLLMLVAAFIGLPRMKLAYQHAVEQRYRFFSYGDAMFLEKDLENAQI